MGAALAGGRSGERERPIVLPAKGGLLAFGRGHSCRGFLGATASGRPRGRVALPLLRRRSGGGPVPPGGGLGGRFGRRPKRQVRRRAPLVCPSKGSFSLYRRGCSSPGSVQSRRVWSGPGAGSRYHCSAVAAAEVRSRRAAGSRPLRPAAEAATESAPHCPPRDGRAFLSQGGGHFCERFLGATALRRTRAGSRYHCSAVAAAEVRSREAAGSWPLRPGRAEAARASARHRRARDRRAFLRSAGVIVATASLAPMALGRTRGRVALPMRRRWRDGGPPLPHPPGRRAPGRFGPGGQSGDRERAPLPFPRRAGCFSLGGGQFCHRLFGAGASGRTRGRVALPVRRRRRDGGPTSPGPAARRAALPAFPSGCGREKRGGCRRRRRAGERTSGEPQARRMVGPPRFSGPRFGRNMRLPAKSSSRP